MERLNEVRSDYPLLIEKELLSKKKLKQLGVTNSGIERVRRKCPLEKIEKLL
jgi:hypothetical protein